MSFRLMRKLGSLGWRALTLLTLLPAAALAETPPGIPDGWSDGYVYANGIRLHYYRAVPAPGKPVIVMVHGVTDIGLSWTTLTRKLQGAYDIYMMDARAHGLSDPFTPADDADTLVKDVVAFVEVMKFEKPILMGHSLGAATVRRVGAEYPELARAIVMLDPGLGRGGRGGPPPAAAGAASQGGGPGAAAPAVRPPAAAAPDRLSFSMRGTPEVLIAQNNYRYEDLLAKCRQQSSKWDVVDCQYWALSKRQYHGAYTPEAWQAMSGPMGSDESLAKISVPALILKADAPPDVRLTHQEAAGVMQKGRLVHIDGAGHNLHHDQLERTVAELTTFFATLK